MLKTSSNSVRHDAVSEAVVVAAAVEWFRALRTNHSEVIRTGYFGSYARGDYVPGSDFDVLMEVSDSPFASWQDRLPVYAPERFPTSLNLFVYTSIELARLRAASDAFLREAERTVRWLTP